VGLFVNAVLRNLEATIEAEKDLPEAGDNLEEIAFEQLCKSFDKTPMAGLLSVVDAIGTSLPPGACAHNHVRAHVCVCVLVRRLRGGRACTCARVCGVRGACVRGARVRGVGV
jgi:hypothetical protein